MSLSKDQLMTYLQKQMEMFFPDGFKSYEELNDSWNLILERVEYCFSKNKLKYFSDVQGNTIFNHLNGDHYSMFLYFASNTLYKQKASLVLCDKLFQLNRCLHGIDAFYEVELPEIFLFSHPTGTVLGKAKYSDYLLVFQNCNVGGSINAEGEIKYPVLGEYVSLQTGSFILGNCHVGNCCTIAAGSMLLNRDLPNHSLYIGSPRDHFVRYLEKHSYEWG